MHVTSIQISYHHLSPAVYFPYIHPCIFSPFFVIFFFPKKDERFATGVMCTRVCSKWHEPFLWYGY